MKRTRIILGVFILSLASLSGMETGKRMTVEDRLAVKSIGGIQVSPNGKWIAYTLSEWDKDNNSRKSHIHLVSADGSRSFRLTNGEKGESSPQWSPDGARMAFSADRGKGQQIWIIPVSGGEAEVLTSEENSPSNHCWSPDGRSIAFTIQDIPQDKEAREKRKKDKFDTIVVEKEKSYTHLWTINIATKDKKRLTEGAFSASSPKWSPDGKWIAYVSSSSGASDSSYAELSPDPNTDIYIVSAEGGAPVRLTSNPGPDNNPCWSPDGRRIAYTAGQNAWADKTDIMIVKSQGGPPLNLTQGFFESAGSGLTWSPDGRSVYFRGDSGAYSHIFNVPADGGQVKQITKGSRNFGSFFLSADGAPVFCAIADSRSPEDIYSIAVSGGPEMRLTTVNPQLKDFDLAPTEVVKWKGPDKLDVEGILVFPTGYEIGKRYPLILQIHGGPYGRFSDSFNGGAQVFAAKGFAILMPNPRGSTGYGLKFIKANVGDWGGKDFQDIMAGVDAVIAKGVADPEKLVVMGGSYGGFMTFWTVTQTNRFKAAIGHAGISDWYSFHGQSDIPALMEFGFSGFPWISTAVYRKFSPMTYVDKAKTPLMITHGESDRRVPIAQAEELYRALQRRGVEVVFLRYPREGHGIQEPNHQIDLFNRQLEWFDSHLRIIREKPKEESSRKKETR